MTITINATKRDALIPSKILRAEGKLPAVVYGPTHPSVAVTVDAKVFEGVLKNAGESTIITLEGLDKPLQVLIKQVDFNSIKQLVQHVDLYVVAKGMEISTNVPLVFVNEAPVVTMGLGTLNEVHKDVPVTCEASVLPHHIEVDVSSLVTVEDKVLVSDLKITKGVTVDLDDSEAIVVVSGLNLEEEIATTATDEDLKSVK
jgi:large subunit ribosomal protein L25